MITNMQTIGLLWEGPVRSSSGMASMMFRKLACWRTVMQKRTLGLQQAGTMAWL